MAKPRLACLLGDPSGVGPEMAVKLLAREANRQAADLLLIADRTAMASGEKFAGASLDVLAVESLEALRFEPGRVTLLPARTPLNLNTAEPELIYAAVPGVEMDRVQRAVALRGAKPFANLAEAAKALDVPPERLNADQHAIATRFFEIQGRLRYGNIAVQEISLVQRDGQEVSVLWRRRGVPLPTMAPPAAEAAPNAPLPPTAS